MVKYKKQAPNEYMFLNKKKLAYLCETNCNMIDYHVSKTKKLPAPTVFGKRAYFDISDIEVQKFVIAMKHR